ncbi:MAG: asparagine synthase (glutamine-hydrolyzing) [Planctomycetota bacterium]
MCGIAGILDQTHSTGSDELRRLVTGMSRALIQRGPDDDGQWADAASGVALAQRRLAVVDLTATGAQPMVSSSMRHVIVYNGECYDLSDLRADVERAGPPMRGTSDTEVILEAIDRLGIAKTLPRLVGMFAFALWDRRDRCLHLVRDRLGIKPLYLTRAGRFTAFASEVCALAALPGFDSTLDRDVLAAYLRRNCLPDGRSAHPGTRQVRPGTMVTIAADGRERERVWWSLSDVIAAGQDSRAVLVAPGSGEERDLIGRVDGAVSDAVRIRMIADVPLGAFLSGGIDSTTVVAMMQAHATRPVRTFTLGSHASTHDESAFARAVASHLGTEHTELIVSPGDAAALVPGHLAGMDQPFADSSSLPTYLVSRLARQDVTVALSGDGGDEVFGGYTRHRVAAGRLGQLLRLPRPARRAVAQALRAVPVQGWDSLAMLLPPSIRPGAPGDQVHKGAASLAARDLRDLHDRLTTHWPDPSAIVRGSTESPSWTGPPDLAGLAGGPMEFMLALDSLGYLPDDILTKVDRASMAVSLEARVPLLDHRLVELAWTLPSSFRVREGRTKWVLREVLARHVPPGLTERPKRGFGQPIGSWLRGPLRPWAEDLFTVESLSADDLFNPAPIRALWDEHLRGRRSHAHLLWDVLALQAWRHKHV